MLEEVTNERPERGAAERPTAGADRRGFAWAVAALAGLLAVGFLLVFRRDAGGLWRDEVNSVNFSNLPSLGDLWRHLDNESFPLLWMLIERAWSPLLGTSDAALRDVGLATALALLAAVWLGARRCGYAPALALALLAGNPVLLRTASLNRAYGFGFLLIVLTYYALWRFAEGPTRRRGLVAGGLALLATQTLYYDIVFVAAMLVGALGVRWRRGDRGALWPLTGIGGLCALSLVPYVSGPIRAERGWSFLISHKMPAWQVLDVVGQALHLQSQYQSCTGGTLLATAVWVGVGALCLYGLAAYAPRAEARWADGGDAARFASATVLVAVAGNALVLSLVGYMIEPFHLSAITVLVAVAAGHAGARLRPAWVARALIPALALLVPGTNLLQTYRAMAVRQTNADLVAAVVNARARPGDFVMVAPYWLGQPFARYYHGPAPWTTPPALTQYAYGGENYILDHMLHPTPDMAHVARIRATLRAGHSVWLVSGVGQFPSVADTTRPQPQLPPYPPDTRANFHDFLERLMEQDAYALSSARTREGVPLPFRQDVNPEEHLEVARYGP